MVLRLVWIPYVGTTCIVCQSTSKGLRSESHDQVFCTIFLHLWFELSHLDAIFLLSFLPDGSVGFFNKLLNLSHVFFFAVKAFMLLVRNFFEICCGNRNITSMCFVNSLLFLIYQNDTSRFTKKQKAAATVINSYLGSAANCMRRL